MSDAPTFRYRGQLWHKGWDIPTVFEQRHDGTWWRNQAHGGDPDFPVTAEQLIEAAQEEGDEETAATVAKLAGLHKPWPAWARRAKREGWTPPEGWSPP